MSIEEIRQADKERLGRFKNFLVTWERHYTDEAARTLLAIFDDWQEKEGSE